MTVEEAIRRLQTFPPGATVVIPNDGRTGVRSDYVELAYMEESDHTTYPARGLLTLVVLGSKAPVAETPDTGGMLSLGEYP